MKRGEEGLQRALVAFLRASLPKPWLVFHVPNGGGRSKAEGGILKAMGVRAGIPDLFLLGPNSRLIAIECKAPPRTLKTRARKSLAKARFSEAQQETIAALGELGVPTLIARNVEETIAALAALGVPFRGRVV